MARVAGAPYGGPRLYPPPGPASRRQTWLEASSAHASRACAWSRRAGGWDAARADRPTAATPQTQDFPSRTRATPRASEGRSWAVVRLGRARVVP
eukprot:scaffold20388_cov53-Phaeocystis_antarctica.AAC.2